MRSFTPIGTLLSRSGRKAEFPLNGAPLRAALKWHYEMCVVENMCALMLEAEDGAKRKPWREGPILIPRFPAPGNVGPGVTYPDSGITQAIDAATG